ncbi:flagellar assembly protein A [Neobacillus sp. K501]
MKRSLITKLVDKGLDLFRSSKPQVVMDNIQSEPKDFFSPESTKHVYEPVLNRVELESMDKEEYGQVWVKDGQIFCKETVSHFPTITPPEGVSVYKNGSLVTKTTAVTQKDEVIIKLQNEFKTPSWSIELDDLKMTATLHLEPGYRKTYRIVDHEPSSHIQLEVQLHEESIIPLQKKHLEQRMKALGISYGIQKLALHQALEAEEPGVFTIARGVSPKNGEDGWLECVVETKMFDHNKSDKAPGSYRFPQVEKGQLIGVIHSPKTGKVGYSVTGDPIQPDAPKNMIVHVGRGVDIVDEGTKLVAVKPGRPYIYHNGIKAMVSVIPKATFSTNLDGRIVKNLHLGDIEVEGDVGEGIKLEALAAIMVRGSVDEATIQAGSRIIVSQNVINSHLSAGKIFRLFEDVSNLIGKISKDIKQFAVAVEQVYQSPVFKTSDITKMGLSSLIRILLENKFRDLPPLIKEFNVLIKKADKLELIDSEYREVCSILTNGFLKMVATQFKNPEDVATLVKRLDDIHVLNAPSKKPDAQIILPYTLNSELYCNGDIFIVGKGSFHTKIHSEGKVQISGVLRGGVSYAAGGIEVNETGNTGGTPTRIKVPDDQSIKINQVLEGTIIEVGSHVHYFKTPEENVFARVSKEGKLLLK